MTSVVELFTVGGLFRNVYIICFYNLSTKNKAMNKIRLLVTFLVVQAVGVMQAQWIDSSSAMFFNDTLEVHIEGDVFILDSDAIKRVSDSVKGDSILVDVIFLPCSPFQQLAPYDTTFIVTGPFSAGINYLRLYTILWEDTIGTCYGYTSNQVVDTLNLSFNVPLSYSDPYRVRRLNVYPNPINGFVSIEGLERAAIESVEIFNTAGASVLKVVKPENGIDVSGLPEGVYFIKCDIDGHVAVKKILKE